MLLHGVDMPGLAGWISATHADADVDKTVAAVAGTLIASVGNDVSFWLTAVGYVLSVGGITRLRPSEYHGVPVRPRRIRA